MEALARISVFVKMSAVEKTQPVAVVGEVRGYPIQNHSNAALVQVINETHEILRRPVTAGGSKVTRNLITPGGVVGMFHHGEELHMGKAHFFFFNDTASTE